MTESLNMSLDDIIKNNKKSSSGSQSTARFRGRAIFGSRYHGRLIGRGSVSGSGPTRRTDTRITTRTTPYFVPQAFHVQRMPVEGKPVSVGGAKLYISNLNYEVTNEDIKVLFSDIGELKRYSLHYDRSGRSKGTAEVEYVRQPDALAAMKKYNNAQLDGKPMKLEFVGVNIVTPVPSESMNSRPLPAVKRFSNVQLYTQLPRSGIQGRVVGRGQELGGNAPPGSGPSRGGDHGLPKKVSAEDLDADLESYRLQAMHIN